MAKSKQTEPAVAPEAPEPDAKPKAAAPPPPPEEPEPADEPKKKGRGKPEPMPGLIEGRTVHYTLGDGKRRGEHRAAIISYVHDHGAGLVNLHVLLNGEMDYVPHAHPGNNWLVHAVPFSADPKAEGHWHWIERA